MSFRLERVTFSYDGRKTVLRDVTVSLPAGKTVVVLGRSGLGKTTLLHLLALLWERPPTSGDVFYGENTSYRSLDGATRNRLRRWEFGLVPQMPHFLSGFTCLQGLHVPLSLQGISAALQERRVKQVLDIGCAPELRARLRAYPIALSTGERQRLSAMRGIMHDPAVIFADEPVSNLDHANKLHLLELFRRWQRNELLFPDRPARERTLFLVCHEIETAWEMAGNSEDVYLFLHPGDAGARVEPRTREQLSIEYGADFDDPVKGPTLIRRRLGLIAEALVS